MKSKGRVATKDRETETRTEKESEMGENDVGVERGWMAQPWSIVFDLSVEGLYFNLRCVCVCVYQLAVPLLALKNIISVEAT